MTVSQDHRIIAMWSGPRNVSTALMYSFAQRQDCAVWDEPYYAAWLAETGQDHPMRDAVLGAGPVAASDVAARVLERPTDAASVHYQKHMAHHMLPAFDLDNWFSHATHAFLIREPASCSGVIYPEIRGRQLRFAWLPAISGLVRSRCRCAWLTHPRLFAAATFSRHRNCHW